MGKRSIGKSLVITKARMIIQAVATLLSNIHLPNIVRGQIYQGHAKIMCVPGLNCYSCPAATGACPIGALQAVAGSSKFSFSYYVTGLLMLIGVTLGRFACGYLCPFGWFQELIHRIPGRKLKTDKFMALRYLKYVILVMLVVMLPIMVTNELGMGTPYFCKYLCPQGILEGALPLAAANKGIRNALGALFSWKLTLLVLIIMLSRLIYRPFCKWLCPLGAAYALFNRIALLGMTVDDAKCISCGRCRMVCRMDVDVRRTSNHAECIRCGMCIRECPADAIRYCFGFWKEKPEDSQKKWSYINEDKINIQH